LFEEAIQFELLPYFQPEKTGAELSCSFQPHFAEQHARHLRIVRWRLYMRGKELELLRFALLVENLDGGQPARLRGTVQLTQIAESLLTRTIGGTHRFDQRPVRVILAAMVRPQKHSDTIVS
jgi:hypothetical protein